MSERVALAELIDRHYALVYRYAYRLTGSVADAEDLTQQTFLQAQAKWDQLRDPAAAKNWLCTITRNLYLHAQRTAVRPVSLELAPEPRVVEYPEEIDAQSLQSALNELPEDFRTPLILFYFQEFSYKEIAAQMNIPLGTVMSRLARAKEALRRRLTGEVDSPPSGRSHLTPLTQG